MIKGMQVHRLWLLMVLWWGTVAAAAEKQEWPWHPLAQAYTTALFVTNIEPIDWELVEATFERTAPAKEGFSAMEALHRLDQRAGTSHGAAVQTAIAAKKADALYTAATHAVSAAIRHQLEAAAGLLDRPGMAVSEIRQAQELYRAFEPGIRQVDPDGFRSLGLAWLELTSSVGGTGLVAVGEVPADRPTFFAARAIIESYLESNYETPAFAARVHFEPIPEQRFLAEPRLRLAPWLPPGSRLAYEEPLPRLVLNIHRRDAAHGPPFLVAFGDMLFHSPEIFGEPARSLGLSCATCHNQGAANAALELPGLTARPGVIDMDSGYFNLRFNDYYRDALDIPSLRGIRFTAPYGRDGRFASLRDFTRQLIVNAFNGDEPDPLVLDALIAYMMELDFLPAPLLGRDGRLVPSASGAARRGENFFHQPLEALNGRSCASCHMPDSHFTDNQSHDIGSTVGEVGQNGAMDTPSLLNGLHTAPYFHDGRFSTLAEVVEWYDAAFGLDVDGRTKADLTAYLEAVGEATVPYEIFDGDRTPLRLTMERLVVVLGTLDVLIPAQDRHHIDLLMRTVATDMEAVARNMNHRPDEEQIVVLAEQLWHLRDLVNREDWAQVEAVWHSLRATGLLDDQALR